MFLAVSIGMTLVVLVSMLAALRRVPQGVNKAHDVAVYRDQLASVETDVARGVVTEAEAERLRVEIKRRILEADRTARGALRYAPKGATLIAGAMASVVVIGGAVLGYQRLGAPGYPDLPLKARIAAADEARRTRPDQATAEANVPPAPQPELEPGFVELLDKLRETVKDRPRDVRGLELLARNEAGLGNFIAAYNAQGQLVAVKGDTATAEEYVGLADLMILAAGGYVSPQAERILAEALRRDPANPVARYYVGVMHDQTGRPDLAFRFWEPLLRNSKPDDPWVEAVRAQIGDVALRAGVEYTVPSLDTLRGPTADDVNAAQQMTVEQRMEMIAGMVGGLAERLATEGGPPAEWARLIRSLNVLGRTDEAAQIWAEAQQVFPDPASRTEILQAAQDAGIAE